MDKPLMECGHTANAKDGDGNPVCVICIGINQGATVVERVRPSLVGRKARCGYYHTCGSERDSSFDLAFFEHKDDQEHDEFYCGCYGWD